MKKSLFLLVAVLFLPLSVFAGDYDHCRGAGDIPSEAEVVKNVDPASVTASTDYRRLSEAAINISPMNAAATAALRKQAACAESTFIRLHPGYFEDDKRPKRKPLKHYSWTGKTLQEAKLKQAELAKRREAKQAAEDDAGREVVGGEAAVDGSEIQKK